MECNLRDVWVSWFESEFYGFNVSEFHEWRKDDFIELVDTIPIVKLSTDDLYTIENSLNPLPAGLLESVKDKAYIRANNQRTPITYCFIATDGERFIIVDTVNTKHPVRKSRMIPRQEKQVFDLVKDLPVNNTYEFDKSDPMDEEEVITYKSMVGLTRKEKQLKKLFADVLEDLKYDANLSKVRYCYGEMNPDEDMSDMFDFDEAIAALFHTCMIGWNEKHENLCKMLIGNDQELLKVWEEINAGAYQK